MLAQPSMIKRPVLDLGGGKLLVGFKPELYAEAVSALNASGPSLSRQIRAITWTRVLVVNVWRTLAARSG